MDKLHRKIISLIIFFLLPLAGYSQEKIIAKVVKFKGNAQKQEIDAKNPSPLKPNEPLKNNTLIITQKKSFVRVLFKDKSVLTVGPDSEAVISSNKDNSINLISLIKGKVRSAVQKSDILKDEKEQSKFLIQSETAAFGVRGTDFIGNYAAKTKSSSVVTFDGSVAFNKQNASISYQKYDADREIRKLKRRLAKRETVLVNKGNFSVSRPEMAKPLPPAKVDSKILRKLDNNEALSEELDFDKDLRIRVRNRFFEFSYLPNFYSMDYDDGTGNGATAIDNDGGETVSIKHGWLAKNKMSHFYLQFQQMQYNLAQPNNYPSTDDFNRGLMDIKIGYRWQTKSTRFFQMELGSRDEIFPEYYYAGGSTLYLSLRDQTIPYLTTEFGWTPLNSDKSTFLWSLGLQYDHERPSINLDSSVGVYTNMRYTYMFGALGLYLSGQYKRLRHPVGDIDIDKETGYYGGGFIYKY